MSQSKAARRWAKILDEHEASGLTIRAFAKERDVNPSTLAWWRSRLGRTKRRSTRSPFVQLAVVPDPEARVSNQDGGSVVLALDDVRAHVVVDEQTDLGLLKRLLAALC